MTTGPRHASSACRIAATLLACLLVAGCSDDDPGADPPEETPSSSPTTSDTASPSPTSTVEAASGVLLDPGRGATIRAPKGFERMADLIDFNKSASDPGSFTQIGITILPSAREGDLDELARLGAKHFEGKATRAEDVEIAGETFYHLTGRDQVGIYQDEFSVARDHKIYSLTFMIDPATSSQAERTEIIDSVLASFAWTDG